MSDPPANAPPLNQPHPFELAGDRAQITYDTTGISGGPLFNYKDGPHPIQELGTKIPTVDHELGSLVTAMLGVSALENVRLTLLVPRIELRGEMRETALHTLVIGSTYETEGRLPVPQT